MYYTYIIRCEDNSLYTGITNNIERRMEEHFKRLENCAKYTYTHKALSLECVFSSSTRSLASKLEYQLKHLTKIQKEDLINNIVSLKDILNDKIDYLEYNRINLEELD